MAHDAAADVGARTEFSAAEAAVGHCGVFGKADDAAHAHVCAGVDAVLGRDVLDFGAIGVTEDAACGIICREALGAEVGDSLAAAVVVAGERTCDRRSDGGEGLAFHIDVSGLLVVLVGIDGVLVGVVDLVGEHDKFFG